MLVLFLLQNLLKSGRTRVAIHLSNRMMLVIIHIEEGFALVGFRVCEGRSLVRHPKSALM